MELQPNFLTSGSQPHPCLHTLAAHGLYVHSIPGRLRIELPALLDNSLLAQKLTFTLERLAGVQRAVASATTGRLLVEYEDEFDSSALLERLRELGCLAVCGHASHFTSPNTLVELAVEQVVKLGAHLILGI
jgi:hypothetical protein